MKKCPSCGKPTNKCKCSLPNLGECDDDFTVVEASDPISPIDYPEPNNDDGSESYDNLEFESQSFSVVEVSDFDLDYPVDNEEDTEPLDVKFEDYEVGDSITFDDNYYGVTPRIGHGTILKISGGLASHGNTSPSRVFKIKGDNGRVFNIDEDQIVESKISEELIVDYPDSDLTTDDDAYDDLEFEDYQYNNDGLDSPHYDDSNPMDDEELIVEVDDSEDEECPICGCSPCECDSLTEELGDNQQPVDKVRTALSDIISTIDSADDGFFDGMFGGSNIKGTFQDYLDILSSKSEGKRKSARRSKKESLSGEPMKAFSLAFDIDCASDYDEEQIEGIIREVIEDETDFDVSGYMEVHEIGR